MKKPNSTFTVLEIIRYERELLSKGTKSLFGWMLFLFISAVAAVAPPLFLRHMVDVALPSNNYKLILTLAFVIAFAVLVQEVGKALSLYFLDSAIIKGVNDLQVKTFENLQYKRLFSIRSMGVDSIYQRITDGAIKIREAMQLFLGEFVFYFVITIISISVLFTIDPWIIVILVAVYTPYIVLRHKMFKNMGTNWNAQIEAHANVIKTVRESLEGIILIKTSGTADKELDKLDQRHESFISAVKKHLKILCRGAFLNTMMFLFPEGLVYLYLGYQILEGQLQIGDLLATIGLLMQFRQFIWHVSRLNFHRDEHGVHIQRLKEIEELPDDSYKNGDVDQSVIGNIRFEHVVFSYDQKNRVLDGFTFEINPGEQIGLVGVSGVGKSTIANLIVGLEQPDKGDIFIDGIDLKDWDIHSLRKQLSYISQDTYLINGTLLENIKYGLDYVHDDQIKVAIESADLDGFIASLPDGLDTVVGEKGVQLSGGQRQRLSIARAYLRQPQLLIFDETTASLDLESEHNVQAALDRLRGNKTTIIIAHRLVTLKNVDRIVVLKEGKMIELGSHQELMDQQGFYAAMYEEQWTALRGKGA